MPSEYINSLASYKACLLTPPYLAATSRWSEVFGSVPRCCPRGNCPLTGAAIPQIGMEVLKASGFAMDFEVGQVRGGLFWP